jgi:hypothetical protein
LRGRHLSFKQRDSYLKFYTGYIEMGEL